MGTIIVSISNHRMKKVQSESRIPLIGSTARLKNVSIFVALLVNVIVAGWFSQQISSRTLQWDDFVLPILPEQHSPRHQYSNQPRRVTFLEPSDWTDPQKEAYSGMWWQSTSLFVELRWGKIWFLEQASFQAFRDRRARKTRDWLDFSVTHLSKYWKHFANYAPRRDVGALEIIGDSILQYIQDAEPLPILSGSAAPETLAVIPYVADEEDSYLFSDTCLIATITSLWQIGIKRCIVVIGQGMEQGTSSREWELQRVENALHRMEDKLDRRPMQLQLVVARNVTDADRKIMPVVALRQLQQALLGRLSQTDTPMWLGDDTSWTWKYIYFTEPDLILHARPSAIPAITEQMNQGKVISGHRFQPLPHQSNFPDYEDKKSILPSDFSNLPVIEMDFLNEKHICCDAGNYYPSNINDTSKAIPNNMACGKRGYWWACGFRVRRKHYDSLAQIREAHAYLRDYQFYRIRGGTPFPVVDHHQRTCIFKTLGTCGDDDDDDDNE